MKLTDLRIRLMTYGPNEGKYMGDVSYECDAGKVTMNLDPEISNIVLAAVGTRIVEVVKSPALALESALRQSITEAQNAPTLTA